MSTDFKSAVKWFIAFIVIAFALKACLFDGPDPYSMMGGQAGIIANGGRR